MASTTFRIALFLAIVAVVGASYFKSHKLPIQILELKTAFKCENNDYYHDVNVTVSDYFYVLPNKYLKKFNASQVYNDKPLIIKYNSLFKFKPMLTIDHICGVGFEYQLKDCIMRSTMHLSFDNDEPMDQVNEQQITIQLARAGHRAILCGEDRKTDEEGKEA